jgi:hypothetical protein
MEADLNTSLYVIEDSLQQLAYLREQAEAEGDSEALEVIDVHIAEYLDREATKVSSYVSLIRLREDQEQNCELEIERWTALRNKARADKERLKATALSVMQAFGVKALIDTRTGSGLRRQKNGGLQPLEIAEPESVHADYQMVTVRMPLEDWRKFENHDSQALSIIARRAGCMARMEPNTEAIRKALTQRVVCPECGGNGKQITPLFADPCPRCNGTGTIPQTIPGAKILERSEHVRII